MKKLGFLLSSLLLVVILPGCLVIPSTRPVIQSSSQTAVPDISGTYTNADGQESVVTKTEGSTNVFHIVSPDEQNSLVLLLEPLTYPGSYLFQIENPFAGRDVLLALGVITDRTTLLFDIKTDADAVKALARENGLTINEEGVLVGQGSVEEVKSFFDALLTSPDYAVPSQQLTPGE